MANNNCVLSGIIVLIPSKKFSCHLGCSDNSGSSIMKSFPILLLNFMYVKRINICFSPEDKFSISLFSFIEFKFASRILNLSLDVFLSK